MEKAGELYACDRATLLYNIRKVNIEKSEQGTVLETDVEVPKTLQQAYKWHLGDCSQCREVDLQRPSAKFKHFMNRLVKKQDTNHLGGNKKGGMENL